MLYIDNFLTKGNFTFDDLIKLNSTNDKIYTSFSQMVRQFNNLYKKFKIDYESGMSKEKLEEKHKKYFEAFNNFRNSLLYHKNNHNVTTQINDGFSSAYDELKTFTIGYGNFYGDFVSIAVNLGAKLTIDYKKSVYYKKNRKTPLAKSKWKHILPSTYINKKYTKKMI